MNDNFYRKFEDKHRGSRELIKERLRVYEPLIMRMAALYPKAPALDVGCGRGEWLEILHEHHLDAVGVDLDAGMLHACEQLGLNVIHGDGLVHLQGLAAESQAVVSAFHVVEHVTFDQLRDLVANALRVLKPGGLLVMETPNPENILVGSCNFYIDPTHQRPIPPPLLSSVAELTGFGRVKTMRLQESPELAESPHAGILSVLKGVSPDYAIVAQKSADAETLAMFDEVFEREYGLTLEELAGRYEANQVESLRHFQQQAIQAEFRARQSEARAQQSELRAQQSEARAQQSEARAQQSDAYAHEARAESSSLAEKVVAADARAHHESVISEERSKEIGRLVDMLGATHRELATLREALRTSEANADRLRQEVEYWHLRLVQIHDSKSWKITGPLRRLTRFLRKLRTGMRAPLAHGINYVMARPAARAIFSRALKRIPLLHSRLLAYAKSRGLLMGMANEEVVSERDVETVNSLKLLNSFQCSMTNEKAGRTVDYV